RFRFGTRLHIANRRAGQGEERRDGEAREREPAECKWGQSVAEDKHGDETEQVIHRRGPAVADATIKRGRGEKKKRRKGKDQQECPSPPLQRRGFRIRLCSPEGQD